MTTVTVPKPMKFALRVRTPVWSQINGVKSKPGQYWLLRQTWSKTQTITLDFSVPVHVRKGRGAADGKIAVARGPQILALDKVYNPELDSLAFVCTGRGCTAPGDEHDLSRSGWNDHL